MVYIFLFCVLFKYSAPKPQTTNLWYQSFIYLPNYQKVMFRRVMNVIKFANQARGQKIYRRYDLISLQYI